MSSLPVVLIVDNVRSAYNVGSIWRTADAVGVTQLILTGITPHPTYPGDPRLTHIAVSDTKLITKTALGATNNVKFQYYSDITTAIAKLRRQNYQIYGLEQTSESIDLFELKPIFPLALVVGHETAGLAEAAIELTDAVVEIPQYGHKESLNVSVAAGIALYFLRYKYNLSP